jgi:hypothetical protein
VGGHRLRYGRDSDRYTAWSGKERKVSKGGTFPTGYDTITDKVFLPTEYEMFGANTFSDATQEVGTYQGRLEYYDSNAKRKKRRRTGRRVFIGSLHPSVNP